MQYFYGTQYVNFYQLMAVILIASLVVPWILLLIPIILLLAMSLFKVYISAFREANRLEALSKSPLISFIAESIAGSSTIRAYGKNKEFILESNRLLNRNIVASHTLYSILVWFSLRIDLLTVIVLVFSCTFAIMVRNYADSIFLAMMLSYILTMQQQLLFTIRLLGGIEGKMVCMDRIL